MNVIDFYKQKNKSPSTSSGNPLEEMVSGIGQNSVDASAIPKGEPNIVIPTASTNEYGYPISKNSSQPPSTSISVTQVSVTKEIDNLLTQTLRQIAGQATEILQCVCRATPLNKEQEIAIAEVGIKLDEVYKFIKYGGEDYSEDEYSGVEQVVPDNTAEYLPSTSNPTKVVNKPPMMKESYNYIANYMKGY